MFKAACLLLSLGAGMFVVTWYEVTPPRSRNFEGFLNGILPGVCVPLPPKPIQTAVLRRLGVRLLQGKDSQVLVDAFIDPETGHDLPLDEDEREIASSAAEPLIPNRAALAGLRIRSVLRRIDGTEIKCIGDAEEVITRAGRTVTIEFDDDGTHQVRTGIVLGLVSNRPSS